MLAFRSHIWNRTNTEALWLLPVETPTCKPLHTLTNFQNNSSRGIPGQQQNNKGCSQGLNYANKWLISTMCFLYGGLESGKVRRIYQRPLAPTVTSGDDDCPVHFPGSACWVLFLGPALSMVSRGRKQTKEPECGLLWAHLCAFSYITAVHSYIFSIYLNHKYNYMLSSMRLLENL